MSLPLVSSLKSKTLSELACHIPLTQIDVPLAVYQENLKYERKITLPVTTWGEYAHLRLPLEDLMGFNGEKGGIPCVVRNAIQFIHESGVEEEGLSAVRPTPSYCTLPRRHTTMELSSPSKLSVTRTSPLRSSKTTASAPTALRVPIHVHEYTTARALPCPRARTAPPPPPAAPSPQQMYRRLHLLLAQHTPRAKVLLQPRHIPHRRHVFSCGSIHVHELGSLTFMPVSASVSSRARSCSTSIATGQLQIPLLCQLLRPPLHLHHHRYPLIPSSMTPHREAKCLRWLTKFTPSTRTQIQRQAPPSATPPWPTPSRPG
ncbi:hypothetical protein DFH07DRAFT_977968 [Mycena maculata]|uniref:Uncharacterized protein n=1 Tax=Mycena maculata TaxID=230809 RepID=A0AAD7N487_9AGAR|nr:hypothetical protein DFH07DRAFT_977968 [Mycena maculata]